VPPLHRLHYITPFKGAPATAWEPTDEASLAFYIDFHDPAGNGVIPANGVRVPQLVDKSANAMVLTQGTATKQGLYVENALNGYGGVDYDVATFQKYVNTTAGALVDAGTPFTLVTIMQLNQITSGFRYFWHIRGAAAASSPSFLYSTNASYSRWAIATNSVWALLRSGALLPDPITGSYNAFRMNYNGSGALTAGNFSAEMNRAAFPLVASGSESTFTANHVVGSYDNADNTLGFDGVMLALLLFSSNNATLNTNINSWINTRYGL
jgi:hypothetical protein